MHQHKVVQELQDGKSHISLFQRKEIRKVFHEGEWWFCVKDAVEALVDTADGTKYIGSVRKRDPGLNSRYPQIVETLNFATASGIQKTNCTNIEGLFRIIQSIPSKKVEPFKQWLAKVGYERIQEVDNPDIAIKRAMTLYKAKGYDDDWIESRISNIHNRKKLTNEWKNRGAIEKVDILTDAIHIEALGVSTKKHKVIKGLKGQNLRDNMTSIELTLSTLGEQATTEITKARNAQGFEESFSAAKSGGKIAGTARKSIEAQTGKSIVSSKNYLTMRKDSRRSTKNTDGEVLPVTKDIQQKMDEIGALLSKNKSQ